MSTTGGVVWCALCNAFASLPHVCPHVVGFLSGGAIGSTAPTETTADPVNPAHYKAGTVEVIDFVREQLGDEGFVAYCRGNVIKYESRAGRKDATAQDHAKAAWYAQMAAHVLDAAKHADPRGAR